MSYAGVVIDHAIELPEHIEEELRHILGVASLDDVFCTPEHETQLATHVKGFLDKSRRRARDCAPEGDWKATLFSLLADLAQDDVEYHTSEKLWNADLKPSPPGVAQSDVEGDASTPCFPEPQSPLPDFEF